MFGASIGCTYEYIHFVFTISTAIPMRSLYIGTQVISTVNDIVNVRKGVGIKDGALDCVSTSHIKEVYCTHRKQRNLFPFYK